jgi:hypothetical protein
MHALCALVEHYLCGTSTAYFTAWCLHQKTLTNVRDNYEIAWIHSLVSVAGNNIAISFSPNQVSVKHKCTNECVTKSNRLHIKGGAHNDITELQVIPFI